MQPNTGMPDPAIGQTNLDEALNLTPGQRLIARAPDIPGTSRQGPITVKAVPVSSPATCGKTPVALIGGQLARSR